MTIFLIAGICILLAVFVISLVVIISGKKDATPVLQDTDDSKSSVKTKVGERIRGWMPSLEQKYWKWILFWSTAGLILLLALWTWDEGLGKGTKTISQTMYPWEGELAQDIEDAKVLNPPGEGYPISIEIKDAFLHLFDFDKLDLYIVARINDKDLPPQRYNPRRGLKPDLNVCQSYKVFLGEHSAYEKIPEGVIEIRMDTTRQWIGPQASNASIVPL